jgi:CheY-like chemotaxis protein
MLRAQGHDVTEAASGEEALARLRERPSIDLLITDLGLPRMSGQELAAAARQLRPKLPILLASGYAVSATTTPELSAVGWLAKPFMADDLARAIAALTKPP